MPNTRHTRADVLQASSNTNKTAAKPFKGCGTATAKPVTAVRLGAEREEPRKQHQSQQDRTLARDNAREWFHQLEQGRGEPSEQPSEHTVSPGGQPGWASRCCAAAGRARQPRRLGTGTTPRRIETLSRPRLVSLRNEKLSAQPVIATATDHTCEGDTLRTQAAAGKPSEEQRTRTDKNGAHRPPWVSWQAHPWPWWLPVSGPA